MIGSKNVRVYYGDTSSDTGTTPILKWGEIHQMFRTDTYPSVIESDKDVFQNIKRSGLHRVAARPTVFPCADVISWIVAKVKSKSQLIMSVDDAVNVASYR